MIYWAWLILAIFAGVVIGAFLIGMLAAARDEGAYRAGWVEGHREGFQDGLKEFGQAG